MGTLVRVVGTGVLGLSCAVRLAEAGYDVEVLTRELPLATTSAVAGGLWLPYRAEPADRVAAWGRATLLELTRLHRARAAGVLLRRGVVLHRERTVPVWAEAVADVVDLEQVRDPAPGYAYGLAATVPVVDMPRYLPHLLGRLERAGARLVRSELAALPDEGLVVNAAGLGGAALAGDPDVRPVRGQVVVLDNPGLTRWLVDEREVDGKLVYVLPRDDDVVVGGSATEGDTDLAPDLELAERILRRAEGLVPALAGARRRAHRVGLRPGRSSVRVQAVPHARGVHVHCYGHGGAGVTLSWGCADEVLALVRGLPA